MLIPAVETFGAAVQMREDKEDYYGKLEIY